MSASAASESQKASVAPGSSKKASQVGQKLKTALRVPPGRLVSSFKAGVGAVGGGGDGARVRYSRSFQGHSDGVWHLHTARLASDKALLASASADQTARIWSLESGLSLALYAGHKGSVNSVAFCPNQSALPEHLLLLTASGDQSAHIWKAPVEGRSGPVPERLPSSEEELDAAGSDDEAAEEDGAAVLRTPLLQLTGHTGVVIAASWLHAGDKLITASWDRTAHVYDAERGEVLHILSGHDQELTHCAGSASEALVATASRDTTFRLWDFREAIGSVAVFQGHSDAVNAVAFAADHRLVSASDDRCVKVWDLRNMRAPEAAVRLDSPVNRLAVSRSGLIAIPHDNRHVRLYTLSCLRVARLPRSHRRMVCAAAWLDSALFTAGFDKQIFAWKHASAKE